MATRKKGTVDPGTSPFLQEAPAEEKVEVVDELPEETVEEKSYLSRKGRSYWEFGLLLAVGLALIAAIGALVFLAMKRSGYQGAKKVSIQSIPEKTAPNGNAERAEKKDDSEAIPKKGEAEAPKVADPLSTGIKILNGGAAGGSAGAMKVLLDSKGYKKVEAGNSEKSSYVGVTVFYQAETKAAAEKVVVDLRAKYPTARIAPGTTAEEKSGPVVIVLGK